jgi:NAD(P)-dependent dehydrogenase (short-subunit alcohol dehydrogenase family)
VLTETLVPVLEKAKLPKVIFVSSSVGSIAKTLAAEDLYPDVWYSVSKTALNGLMATYAKRFPRWKVNAVCPGFRATGMNDEEVTEDKHPKHGAERVAELIAEGEDGVTGTFSNKHGKIPW